ncbi:MAG: diguanylate cyclase [Campylobacterales bacterium]|nr:diguanylate cyclase [Campylobacterales bacterium]
MYSTRAIKWQHLFFVFLVVLLGTALELYYNQKIRQAQLEEKLESLNVLTAKVIAQAKEDLLIRYGGITQHYLNEPYLVRLIEALDREALYKALVEDYALMQKTNPSLQIMHFVDTQNVTLLRMHQSQQFGDNLSELRPIMAHVNRTKEATHAFEAGKNGLTYRITLPLITPDGRHLGVLEFGVEPRYFAERIAAFSSVRSQLLIRSDTLGIHPEGAHPHLQVGAFSVIHPDAFFEGVVDRIDWSVGKQEIAYEGRSYLIDTELALNNYRGEEVAKLLLAQDVSDFVRQSAERFRLMNFTSITLSIALMIMLYLVFTSYTRKIDRSYKEIARLSRNSQRLSVENVKLSQKAHVDPLTHCHNRTHFNDYIEATIQSGRGAVIFFDIDHFKQINDHYGHDQGDRVLRSIADTVRDHLREEDYFARWGGEEFVIVMAHGTAVQAKRKAEELRKVIEARPVVDGIALTCSFGVAQIKKGDTVHTLIERVDALLYRAKNEGRNRVCI